jgi:hypothetical protein
MSLIFVITLLPRVELAYPCTRLVSSQSTNIIHLGIEFHQVKKRTPLSLLTNPLTLGNSVFCDKTPVNTELNGLVQAQDPANDPNLFFGNVSISHALMFLRHVISEPHSYVILYRRIRRE